MRGLILSVLTLATCNVCLADEDYVIGDTYSLEVTANKAKRDFSGPVVGMTDDWIALRFTGTNMETRQFSSEIIRTQVTHILWIPRESISAVHEHTPHEGEWPDEPVAFPSKDEELTLSVVEGESPNQVVGKLKSFDGESITLLRQQVTAEVSKVPILGDIPFAGAFFRNAKVKTHEDEYTLNRSQVQFMSVGKPRVRLMAKTVVDDKK